jgi:dihydrofolate reductase
MTPDGKIGDANKLLFHSKFDLAEFARFTRKTMMILGRHTAQQLIDAGVYPTEDRPYLVITEDGLLNGGATAVGNQVERFAESERWIFYAVDLSEALNWCEQYSQLMGLSGYTVCGGKKVYDEYLDFVDKGSRRPNMVYIFKADVDLNPAKPVKLTRDFDQIVALLKARMVEPCVYAVPCDGNLNLPNPTITSASSAIRGRSTFFVMSDDHEYDPSSAYIAKDRLKFRATIGEIKFLRDQIATWNERRGSTVIDIYMKSGAFHELRFETRAQLDWALVTLNRI